MIGIFVAALAGWTIVVERGVFGVVGLTKNVTDAGNNCNFSGIKHLFLCVDGTGNSPKVLLKFSCVELIITYCLTQF